MWNYRKDPAVAWEYNVLVPKDQELPPIHELLELICYGIKWSPTHSVFKLYFMLCLPKIGGLWEITSTSVYRTNHKELQDLICHYAEEGQPIKLAALLCFLPVRFFCFSLDGEGSDEEQRKKTEWLTRIETLRERISTKILSLIVEEQKLMGSGSSNLAQICKKKKMLMMSVMMLLEIYERFGDGIGFCVSGAAKEMTSGQSERIANFLADKLKESGFPVKNENFEVFKHLNCSCDEKVSGGACGSKFEQKDPKIPVYTKIQSPPITKKQTNGMSLGQQRRPISTHSLQEIPGLVSMVQSNYMSQRFTTKFSPKFWTATEAQTRRPVPGLALCKKLSSFLPVIKRGI